MYVCVLWIITVNWNKIGYKTFAENLAASLQVTRVSEADWKLLI